MQEELLYRMQNAFPLSPRPFRDLAENLGTGEKEVMEQIKAWKEEKIIRQISAIFDTKKLKYQSSLVAFRVPEGKIGKAVELINSHPGVSHNYLRDHDFNIWFTLAVPPDSRLGLEATVDYLRRTGEAEDAVMLPTLKLFKIAVKLDTGGRHGKKETVKQNSFIKPLTMKPRHFAVIRELQKDIPITEEPFRESADRLGMEYEEMFALAKDLKEAGVMRRFATILNHRKAGFTANAMSVWKVPEERAEEVGKQIAQFRAVSHCYLRPSYPNWPYNLFAMVHAKSREECDRIIEDIAGETGLAEYGKLYSTREFKKKRIVYFDPEFERWENRVCEGIELPLV
jgi:DNA-binding Lrp family transcriptional regulator